MRHQLRKDNGKQSTVDICDCGNGKSLLKADLQKKEASCDLISKPPPRVTPPNAQKNCYACFYQKVPECGVHTNAAECESAVPKETGIRDCDWVKDACISRFENYCRNEWQSTLDLKNNPGPLIIQDRSIFTDPAQKNNPIFQALSCTNPVITVDGHGEGHSTLFARAERCMAHASTEKITICDLGCSVAQSREQMMKQAEELRKALAGTNMEVTLEANQADANTRCPSTMRIVIKPKALAVTFGLCSALGGDDHRCYRAQTAMCTDDTTKKERMAICCPQKPEWGPTGPWQNIFGGPAGKWIFNDNGKGCPDKPLTDGMTMPKPLACFEAKDDKAKNAYNACKAAFTAIKKDDETRISKLFAASESKDCQTFYWHLAKPDKKIACAVEEKELDRIVKNVVSSLP